jgi:hypothetical protein
LSSSRIHRGETFTESVSKADSASRQEMRLIQLIEAKDTIERYQKLLKKIDKGTLDVTGFLKAASTDAAIIMTDLMHGGENDKIKLEAAKEVLDRGGFSKTHKVNLNGQVTVDHNTSKMELINMILSASRRAGITSNAGALPPGPDGPVIDVRAEEEDS